MKKVYQISSYIILLVVIAMMININLPAIKTVHFRTPQDKILYATIDFPRINGRFKLDCYDVNHKRIVLNDFNYSTSLHQNYYYNFNYNLPTSCLQNKFVRIRLTYPNQEFNLQKVNFNYVSEKENTFSENPSSLEAYTNQNSYHANDIVHLYIHTAKDAVVRMIHFQTGSIIHQSKRIKEEKQTLSKYRAMLGANWVNNYSFKIPRNITPGYHFIEITNVAKDRIFIPIVILPPKHQKNKNKALIIASTNTWHAYNRWGGASFYNYDINDSLKLVMSYFISTQRPLSLIKITEEEDKQDIMNVKIDVPPETSITLTNHLLGGELKITKWLRRNKIDYDVITDVEMHKDYDMIKNYSFIIFPSHSEYWTRQMFDNFRHYLNDGGSFLSLGGNFLFYKVEYTVNQQLAFMPNMGHHHPSNKQGGQWSYLDGPISKFVGQEYTSDGFATYSGYKVLKANHWIFKGAEVTNGQIIGKRASGHETDKMSPHSPKNTILLAKGTNHGGAHLTYLKTPQGGHGLSFGSVQFTTEIDNPIFSKMILNYIDKIFD